jgi:hypothetical protein
MNVIHFGFFENYGDYESPSYGCDETLCGYKTEIPCENSVDKWKDVTCKKCLKLKDNYKLSIKEEEKAIVQQMGEMAEYLKEGVI